MSTLLEAARRAVNYAEKWGELPESLRADLRAAIAEAEQAPAVVTAEEVHALLGEEGGLGWTVAEAIVALVAERTAQVVQQERQRLADVLHMEMREVVDRMGEAERTAQAVEAARAEEREACARVAETGRFLHDDAPDARFGRACAAAIRARTPASEGKDSTDLPAVGAVFARIGSIMPPLQAAPPPPASAHAVEAARAETREECARICDDLAAELESAHLRQRPDGDACCDIEASGARWAASRIRAATDSATAGHRAPAVDTPPVDKAGAEKAGEGVGNEVADSVLAPKARPPSPASATSPVPEEVRERGWQWRPVDAETAFAPPFCTVRACRGCGCLVAGGPTVCGRCAEDSARAAGASPGNSEDSATDTPAGGVAGKPAVEVIGVKERADTGAAAPGLPLPPAPASLVTMRFVLAGKTAVVMASRDETVDAAARRALRRLAPGPFGRFHVQTSSGALLIADDPHTTCGFWSHETFYLSVLADPDAGTEPESTTNDDINDDGAQGTFPDVGHLGSGVSIAEAERFRRIEYAAREAIRLLTSYSIPANAAAVRVLQRALWGESL